jgi:hypothetical protein
MPLTNKSETRKTTAMRLWELENGRSLEDAFARLETISLGELAEELDLSYATVHGWARRLGYHRPRNWQQVVR